MRLIILIVRWVLCLLVFGTAFLITSILLLLLGEQEHSLATVIILIVLSFYPTLKFNDFLAKRLIKSKLIKQQDNDLIQSTKHTIRFFRSKTFLFIALYAIIISIAVYIIKLYS